MTEGRAPGKPPEAQLPTAWLGSEGLQKEVQFDSQRKQIKKITKYEKHLLSDRWSSRYLIEKTEHVL